MPFPSSRLRAVAVALAAAATATAVCTIADARISPPGVTRVRMSVNRTHVHGAARPIRLIVIHSTEGGLQGSVRWLQSRRARASAHFVVSRNGHVLELVPLKDVAWHSGNKAVNEESIGIEHVGYAGSPVGFTAAEYRASARLVAWLCRRFGIPADRSHIIGHSQVPDPRRPWLSGGISHHHDPGRYWNWRSYMRLVRFYVELAKPLRLERSSIPDGARLGGTAAWSVAGSSGVRWVDFEVDGHVLWRDTRRPFSFGRGRGLRSVFLDNGWHTLVAVGHGVGRRTVAARARVLVHNRPYALTTAGARRWQRVHGVVRLRVRGWGAPTRSVVLRIDGRPAARARGGPFAFRWNTALRRDGRHVLVIEATARDGRVARRRFPVVVSNRPPEQR